MDFPRPQKHEVDCRGELSGKSPMAYGGRSIDDDNEILARISHRVWV